jgi:hypothetical protein
MGRMKDLAVAGVTDLASYLVGVEDENERIIKLLTAEIERVRLMDGYPATNALANVRAELIKGKAE